MRYLLPFFRWCDESWLGETMRSSRLYFPVVETFHLFALTVLFGAIVVLNLRLCRIIMRGQPVQQVARDLSPWTFWGLMVMLVSGVLLFFSEALRCYASKPFQVKMVFLFSAIIFHYTIHKKVTASDRDPGLLTGALVGTVNGLLWLGVGLGGRAIGFI
jgi:hypothetical protein